MACDCRLWQVDKYGSTYEGQYFAGKKEGQGSLVYFNGDKYTGHFFNNKKEGQGRLEDALGGVYEGQWLNNRREGQGTQSDRNGATYAGCSRPPVAAASPPPPKRRMQASGGTTSERVRVACETRRLLLNRVSHSHHLRRSYDKSIVASPSSSPVTAQPQHSLDHQTPAFSPASSSSSGGGSLQAQLQQLNASSSQRSLVPKGALSPPVLPLK